MPTLTQIDKTQIHRIQSLWERNRQHHAVISEHFGSEYEDIRFEDRMAPLLTLPEECLRISAAVAGQEVLGYCISTADGGIGELVSLHVLDSVRGQGIGQLLTEDHLQWLRLKGCTKIQVQVAVENTPALGFYQHMGFHGHYVTLQME